MVTLVFGANLDLVPDHWLTEKQERWLPVRLTYNPCPSTNGGPDLLHMCVIEPDIELYSATKAKIAMYPVAS